MAPKGPVYQPRLLDSLLRELFESLPAIMVVGPRATGKTTTAQRLAVSVVQLDQPGQAAAFAADPDAALARLDEPVLLDEWQAVPGVLGAVKRAVDHGSGAGRFLLTGSVRARLDTETWPGTGRVVRVPMYGLTVREEVGALERPSFIDRVAAGEALGMPREPPDLGGYIDVALASGFPELALGTTTPASRQRWLDGYVDNVLDRDVPQLLALRDPARLRRYLEAYASSSAGTVADTTLYRAAGIDRKTAVAYEQLLTNLMVLEAVPAWTTNRLKRLALAPKRYLVEPALIGSILRVDARAVLRDGDLLGRLLDTFVVAQLRAELAVSATRPRLYHLREEHGRREVDLLAEIGADRIVAFDVKATSAPGPDTARHLTWLRDRLGDRFIAGIVFHTGPAPFQLAHGIIAAPICALWG